MKISKTLYVTNRVAWRSWLKNNHSKEKEIWLVYYKKSSGKPRIPYNDAVDEALCYGWIDSTAKGIDEQRFAQRFTPRRPTSPISEMNKERVRRLIKKGKMRKAGLKAISRFFDIKKDQKEKFVIASDIVSALKLNKTTWKNFQNFSEGYKRVRVGYVEDVRNYNNETFQKRLQNLVKMTAKNKKFGMIE